ncbi:hypothetical protein BG418_10470 [Streptomyces sp. CBMA152]|nr:hypothetical protein [Streptomyces sp. CBMA152]
MLALDAYRYRPDGQRRDRADLERIAAELASGPAWISEGIFLTWTSPLLEAADVIVWLDTPKYLAAYRTIGRWLADRRADRTLTYGLAKCVRLAWSALRPHDLAAVQASSKNLNPSPAAIREATAAWSEKVIRLRWRADAASFFGAI